MFRQTQCTALPDIILLVFPTYDSVQTPIRSGNLFVCLQQNPANFIRPRTAKCMTADLVLRHSSLPSRVLSSSRFSRAEKPRCPVCIPFQLSQHHLIPITLIIAARDVSERRRERQRVEHGESSHLREQECKWSRAALRSLQWQQQQQ